MIRWKQRRRGQAIVELTLVLGVLMMLILGLVCIGQLLLANYTVSQAARAAAHQAALAGGDIDAAREAGYNVIAGGVGTQIDATTIELSCPAPCRRYDPVTVLVTYSDTFWAPLPPLFTEFTVRATATRAAERDSMP